jgi:hypothetical protein
VVYLQSLYLHLAANTSEQSYDRRICMDFGKREFIRPDLTDWVIHFVRDRTPNDDPKEDATEIHDGYEFPLSTHSLESDADAFSVLRHIITTGGFLPGYSFRKKKTTLYGKIPVVCFTEMPVYAFAKYVQIRGMSSRVASYGIAVLKRELFKAGGRPVIYGLSQPLGSCSGDEVTTRILEDSVLPEAEQYRYVPFDLLRSLSPIDWTHEREWRWRASLPEHALWIPDPEYGDGPRPALPLFRGPKNDGFFSHIRILVWSAEEAKEIGDFLLMCKDSGSNNWSEPYDRVVLQNTSIVVLKTVIEEVESHRNPHAVRLEDLQPSQLVTPVRPSGSRAIKEMVHEALLAAQKEAAAAAQALLDGGRKEILDVCGRAEVITHDPSSEVTAALLELGAASAVGGRYYVIDVMRRVPGVQQALYYYEVAAKAAAKELTRRTGQDFDCRSWWD